MVQPTRHVEFPRGTHTKIRLRKYDSQSLISTETIEESKGGERGNLRDTSKSIFHFNVGTVSFLINFQISTDERSGGYGNGTLHPLSLDRDLFEDIMKASKLPDRVKEVICSVHGVFSRFVEYDRGAPRSLCKHTPFYTSELQYFQLNTG